MLPRLGKEFLGRIQFNWRPLFQGRYLLLTNTVAGGGMLALGDAVQQSWEIHKNPGQVRDLKRTGRMCMLGCSLGPVMHYWYGWLDAKYVGRALNTVFKKVLVDQLVASPGLGIWYFLGMNFLEGHTLSAGYSELKDKFWEFYKADWCVWPPAQMIGFYFLSPQFRVIYVTFISLGWDTYLSYLKHRIDSDAPAVASDSSSAVEVETEALPLSKPLDEKT